MPECVNGSLWQWWRRDSAIRDLSDAGRVLLRMATRRFLPLAIALAGAAPALAQTSAVVDEATFMISRKGAPVGRESFRIIRAPGPGGQVFLARATSALGEDRVATTLATDSAGIPVSYEATLSQRGEVVMRLQGRGRPDRFSMLVQSKGGEAAREYLVRPGTMLLDDDQFHQFYFILRAARDSQVMIIAPRTARREKMRLEDNGLESLPIGGQDITARRLALVDSAGGRRELWLDPLGRLLKVSVPEKGLIALRDDPPR